MSMLSGMLNGYLCNCESAKCEDKDDHTAGSCSRPAGEASALYVGRLCDVCAERTPKQFLLPPYGTAKK